jgi:hypothetical protein
MARSVLAAHHRRDAPFSTPFISFSNSVSTSFICPAIPQKIPGFVQDHVPRVLTVTCRSHASGLPVGREGFHARRFLAVAVAVAAAVAFGEGWLPVRRVLVSARGEVAGDSALGGTASVNERNMLSSTGAGGALGFPPSREGLRRFEGLRGRTRSFCKDSK